MICRRVWVTGRPNNSGYLASVSMDVEIAGGYMIQIRGMRLVETPAHRIMLAMPNVRDARGQWQDTFCPLNQLTRDVLESAAFAEWRKQWPQPADGEMR